MGNITEQNQWEDHVYLIEKQDKVLGGEEGKINVQAKQLANRTAYLKDQVDGINRERTGYAPKASPAFSGTPTAPTANQNTNNTQIATTAFVKTAIAALVGSAPAALDTLEELARALAGDANLKQTLLNELAKKLDKSGGTLNGNLVIDHLSSILLGKRNNVLKYGVGLRNSTSDDLILVKYKNGVSNSDEDSAIEIMNDRIRVNKPFYENGNKLTSVAVIKGNIGNGATLPLPAGYTQAQCAWIVSINADVSLDRTRDAITKYTRTECYVDSNRRVISRVFSERGFNTDPSTGNKYDNSQANYLVIGVK